MKSLLTTNPLPLLAVGLMLCAAGCNRDSVKVYKVENAEVTPPTTAAHAAMPTAMPTTMPADLAVPDNSGLPKLKYTLPDGWKEKALTQLRVASFTVSEDGKDADVSVIPLGGISGGDAANVNRWRGQVELPHLDDEAIKKSAEAVTIAGQPGELYDLLGTGPCSGEPERILGAILHTSETAWYFKMTGEAKLVAKQKENFVAFLKSVEFQKLAAPSALDVSQLPPSHPAIPGMKPAEASNASDKPIWVVPADWKAGALAQFLVAKFIIGSGDASAAVNVSQLAGDGGGLGANVNRWRGQLGLAAVDEAEIAQLPTMDATGVKAVVADITGTDARAGKPARLVGVVVPANGTTWFYKLMGNPAVVGAQKAALIQFVQSAKYPAAK